MTAAIRATGLTKAYGDKLALDALDLTVDEGSIFGFLGPNGAGKTTMVRLSTGLARATGGALEVLGRDIRSAGNAVRSEVGFLPDVPAFYGWMTAEEFLRFAGGLFGIRGDLLTDRTEMLLDLAGLTGVTTKIGGYSRGMKQRLGVAQALINAPRLLILDEPTSALDPMGRKDVLDMILSLRGRTTVFFSTHILGDVERVCDSVAILDKGRLITQAPIAELKARYGQQKILLEVTEAGADVASRIARCAWATSVDPRPHGGMEITVGDIDAARREIPAIVVAAGAGITRLEAGEMGLEEVFVELVGGGRP